MITLPQFSINPELDLIGISERFRSDGRVRIGRLFERGAPELYGFLESSSEWVQLVNHQTGAHEISWKDWRRPGASCRSDLEPDIFDRARDGFQYCYAAQRIPTAEEKSENPVVKAISNLMHSEAMLVMLERITGVISPVFTDGQVTAYGEGDFLTGHDDDLAESGRKVAFVLGMTPQWRLEWGGLLLFHEPTQVDFAGLIPGFNTLDLFSIPRYHSVSLVTQAAPRRRFSITGWLSSPGL